MQHLGIRPHNPIQVPHRDNYYKQEEDNFHEFPRRSGWNLREDGELEPIKPQSEPIKSSSEPVRSQSEPKNFETFMQSWLFFGLLSTVVYRGGNLRLDFSDFIQNGKITTELLTGYLYQWQVAEMGDTKGQTIRMIRAQAAIDKARQVVRRYSVADNDRPPPAYSIDGSIALSLMVLGETLTAAKTRIVERVGFNIRGWHGDAGEGWGTPEIIISKMGKSGWCKRTIHVLQCQLKHQAVALLFVYYAHQHDANDQGVIIGATGHQTCSKTTCTEKAEDANGAYKPQDVDCDEENCPSIGPHPDEVEKAIREDKIPLLRFSESKSGFKVEVEKVAPDDSHEYVAISHVWAHGYGNTDKNELKLCQLKYFKKLFENLRKHGHDGNEIYFWIDTLAIPREPDELRVRGLQQMYEIYTRAKYTIVIDNGLRLMKRDKLYETNAMKVLASSWMRRLWTLQEVYLSPRVLFVINENELMDLDWLEDQYSRANMRFTSNDKDVPKTNMPNMARHYFHNIMGQERKERLIKVNRPRKMALVVSVVHAALWRTTTHEEHEVLTLATLFNLMNRSTSFAKAIIQRDGKTPEDVQKKLRELWILLEEVYPGSIPSGIIFLPGKKIDINGFRWAPKTFMVGQEAHYPDPLTASLRPAELETNNGLLVRYPGFLLHVKHPGRAILDPETPDNEFSFATDNKLSEWYTIKSAQAQDSDILRHFSTGSDGFAIILSHKKPVQLDEIGLLVGITRRNPRRELRAHDIPTTYHVLIIRRVYVRRNQRPQDLHRVQREIMSSGVFPDDIILGETLDSDTKWFVGGGCNLRWDRSVSQPPREDPVADNRSYKPSSPKQCPALHRDSQRD